MSIMQSVSMECSVIASQDQVSCEMQGEVVVLSLRTGEYYGLNEVAAAVWDLVQERRTMVELHEALLQGFEGVTAEQCTAELLRLVEEMQRLELVEVR